MRLAPEVALPALRSSWHGIKHPKCITRGPNSEAINAIISATCPKSRGCVIRYIHTYVRTYIHIYILHFSIYISIYLYKYLFFYPRLSIYLYRGRGQGACGRRRRAPIWPGARGAGPSARCLGAGSGSTACAGRRWDSPPGPSPTAADDGSCAAARLGIL